MTIGDALYYIGYVMGLLRIKFSQKRKLNLDYFFRNVLY